MSNVIDFKKVKFQRMDDIKNSIEEFRKIIDTQSFSECLVSLEEGKYVAVFHIGEKIFELNLTVFMDTGAPK